MTVRDGPPPSKKTSPWSTYRKEIVGAVLTLVTGLLVWLITDRWLATDSGPPRLSVGNLTHHLVPLGEAYDLTNTESAGVPREDLAQRVVVLSAPISGEGYDRDLVGDCRLFDREIEKPVDSIDFTVSVSEETRTEYFCLLFPKHEAQHRYDASIRFFYRDSDKNTLLRTKTAVVKARGGRARGY